MGFCMDFYDYRKSFAFLRKYLWTKSHLNLIFINNISWSKSIAGTPFLNQYLSKKLPCTDPFEFTLNRSFWIYIEISRNLKPKIISYNFWDSKTSPSHSHQVSTIPLAYLNSSYTVYATCFCHSHLHDTDTFKKYLFQQRGTIGKVNLQMAST